MKQIVITILLVLFCVHAGFSEQEVKTNVEKYKIKEDARDIEEVAAYLKERQKMLESLNDQKEPESSVRRFEVMFFSSGAMAYFSTYLFVKLFAQFTTGHSSELPSSYWYFIITNSVGMATYISIKDYYEVKEIRNIEDNKQSHIGKNNYKMSLYNQRF